MMNEKLSKYLRVHKSHRRDRIRCAVYYFTSRVVAMQPMLEMWTNHVIRLRLCFYVRRYGWSRPWIRARFAASRRLRISGSKCDFAYYSWKHFSTLNLLCIHAPASRSRNCFDVASIAREWISVKCVVNCKRNVARARGLVDRIRWDAGCFCCILCARDWQSMRL